MEGGGGRRAAETVVGRAANARCSPHRRACLSAPTPPHTRTHAHTLPQTAEGDIDAAELEEIVKEADKDGDGLIDYNEFVELMTKQVEAKAPSALGRAPSTTRGNLNDYK